jgi:hypothetical protein
MRTHDRIIGIIMLTDLGYKVDIVSLVVQIQNQDHFHR